MASRSNNDGLNLDFPALDNSLRMRRRSVPTLDFELPTPIQDGLFEDDSSISDPNFVLPSTPEETLLDDSEHMTVVPTITMLVLQYLQERWEGSVWGTSGIKDDDEDDLDIDCDMSLPARAAEQAEQLVRKVWEEAWRVCHFSSLPKWLQDNDFLHMGHRPPMPSVVACLRSIFRIHTETGNIWTHLLGCIAFIGISVYFLTRPAQMIQWEDKLVFACFFGGAILCLGMSSAFHTLHCHSEKVGKLFSKLDYCGIALLIIGSFIPWLYYGFYCESQPRLIYLVVVSVLGIAAVIVSLWDKFGEPRFRPLRAGVFMGFGLSGVIPAVHYLVAQGWVSAIYEASFGWLVLMGALYILGAMFYALRIPERFFPGKCDIWFHSHQIFHILVIAAAFVHYHGITEMAMYRLSIGDCPEEPLESDLVYEP